MKHTQNTRGYKRYLAFDIHREYILTGGQDEDQEWALTPRRVSVEKFPEWAKKNLSEGDIVVLETTTNVWETYDIVAPLVSRVLVANAAAVGEIVGARVNTDKEDIKRLLRLLFGGIVPAFNNLPRQVRPLHVCLLALKYSLRWSSCDLSCGVIGLSACTVTYFLAELG